MDSRFVICRYYCTLYFEISLVNFDLDSRAQECEKVKTFDANYLTFVQLIWIELGKMLRHDGEMNLILISYCPFNNQGKESNFSDFAEKNNNLTLACKWTFTNRFLSNLAW